MSFHTNAHKVVSAITVLERARDICVNLKPMGCHMTDDELRQRANVIAYVIRARSKLQLLKHRADVLGVDLDRFKARRQAMKE